MVRDMSTDAWQQKQQRKSELPHHMHSTEIRPQDLRHQEYPALLVPQRQEQRSGERYFHFSKPGTATAIWQRYGRSSSD